MVRNFLKLNQTLYGVCHGYLESKTKKNCYSLPRRKVCISIGNIDLIAYSTFKNIEFLSDQEVV